MTRRWRYYRTEAGTAPVREYLAGLDDEARGLVLTAMAGARRAGREATRQVRGEIREVRARRGRTNDHFRVLFAFEGRRDQVMLAVVGFTKKTEQTPAAEIELAERRLRDWPRRARPVTDTGKVDEAVGRDPWDYEDPHDDLEEDIAALEGAHPGARARIEAAAARWSLAHELAAQRRALGLSAADVASRLGRPEADVERLEDADADVGLEELLAYATALGLRAEWRLVAARRRRWGSERLGSAKHAVSHDPGGRLRRRTGVPPRPRVAPELVR